MTFEAPTYEAVHKPRLIIGQQTSDADVDSNVDIDVDRRFNSCWIN